MLTRAIYENVERSLTHAEGTMLEVKSAPESAANIGERLITQTTNDGNQAEKEIEMMITKTTTLTSNWLNGLHALSTRKMRKRRIAITHRRLRHLGARTLAKAGAI